MDLRVVLPLGFGFGLGLRSVVMIDVGVGERKWLEGCGERLVGIGDTRRYWVGEDIFGIGIPGHWVESDHDGSGEGGYHQQGWYCPRQLE